MRSDFKLQKLSLLLILSLSTLSGCIGAPPESAPSPIPEIPVSNDQSQSSRAESSNSFNVSSSTLSPQESTELVKKWDEFLTVLRINIVDESEENFEFVQAKAQELKYLASYSPDLSGFRTYLSDTVISYKNIEGSDDRIYQSFNNDLVRTGLGFPDLAIEGNVITLLSNENKQSTAQQVVDKLNAKYRSLLVSPSSTLTPSPSVTPTPTPSVTPTPTPSPSQGNIVLQLVFSVLALGMVGTSFILFNRKFNVFPSLNAFLFPQRQHRIPDPQLTESRTTTGMFNSSREFDQIKANVSKHNYQFQEYDRKFQENDRQILSLKQTVQMLVEQINTLTQANNVPYYQPKSSLTQASNVTASIKAQPKSSAIPASSVQQKTENPWKQMITQSTPVEDANQTARRLGSGEYPFFVSTKGKAYLGVYQDPSGQDFLLPTQRTASHEKLSSYFDLLKGSFKDGPVEVVQPAIVRPIIIPSGQGWQLYQKGIISFDMGHQLKTQTPPQQEPQPEKASAVLAETPVIPPYAGSPIVLPVVFHLKLETSQNTYKQILSQSTPVEDKNLSSRRMGSGETPLFVSTKSRQSHLGIYQDPSGQIFLLPTKSKTNHEKLSSYFNLLEGSPKDGEVEVVQPAIVIANGQGWELYQKGIVSFM